MPLIATPISHLFENEKDASKIAAVSDCLEVRQRSLNSELNKQWLFHIDIDLTQYWDKKIKEYLTFAITKKKDLKLVTFQATRCCVGEELVNGLFQLSGIVLTKDELLENAKNNVAWFRDTFGESLKLGFENNNFYPSPAYDVITDADFITELVESNNINFLLDIAHAMVTAKNRGFKYIDYLKELPMDRVIQLHICQPDIPDVGMARDTHELPNKEMLDEVSRLVARHPNISFLTVEFYKDANELVDFLKCLQTIKVALKNKIRYLV